METYLDRILEGTRRRLEKLRHRMLADLESEAFSQDPPRDFLGALRKPGVSLVAEIKRRSPSAGEIRGDADPAEVAAAYARGGARALSVLTEPDHFSGSIEDLRRAREVSGLPVLRKDFVIDHYQVLESRAEGSDAVLLIVAAVGDPALLGDLMSAVADLKMAALVEAHDERELDEALGAGARLIGINQRDLNTFEVDTGLAARLRPLVPHQIPVVAESGIRSRRDVELLDAAGVDGILVGEWLMRSGDPETAVADLLGPAGRARP